MKKIFSQQVVDSPTISFVSAEETIKNINSDKEAAKTDLIAFCRDKAVELLHGVIVDGDKLRGVSRNSILPVLEFLANLQQAPKRR